MLGLVLVLAGCRAGHSETSRRVVTSRRSVGCDRAASGSGSYEQRTLEVQGQTRHYALRVPATYLSSRAYPLVFRFHGHGGDALSGGLEIERASHDDALVVSPEGLHKSWNETSESADLEMFDALLAELGASYCLDLDQVYAYGFSAGASFSEVLACRRTEVVRGIAAVAGFERTTNTGCSGRVAAWLAHDRNDEAAPFVRGVSARDRLLMQNGCSQETVPATDGCVRYTGCADGYPVVWCETEGLGHHIRGDYAPEAVWKFFSTL